MRRIALPLTCLLVLLPLLGPTEGRAEEDALTIRTYDLTAFARPPVEEAMPLLGLGRRDAPPSDTREEEEDPLVFLEADAVVEIVQATLPEVAARVELEVWGPSAELIVTATRQDQAAIATVLGTLFGEASRRVHVTARWLRLPPAARKSVMFSDLGAALARGRLTPDQTGALIERAREHGVPVSASSAVVSPGHAALLGQMRSVSFVADYAPEIAQDSIVGNPIVETLREGWVAEVRPFLLQGGRVRLEIAAQAAQTEAPIRAVALDVKPFGSLDLPATRVVRFASSPTLEPGVAWSGVFGGDAAGGLHVLLVEVRPPDGRRAPSAFRRFDVRALTSLPRERALARYDMERGFEPPHLVFAEHPSAALESTHLHHLLRTRLGEGTWEQEGSWLGLHGGAVIAAHDGAVLARVRETLGGLETDLLRTYRLRLSIRREKEGTNAESLASFHLDLPAGLNVPAMAGREVAYVADWDVEVAQEARMGDPQVGVAFGGLAGNLRADPGPLGDAAMLSLRLELSILDAALDVRRPENECTGIVEIPSVTRLVLDQDLTLPIGGGATLRGGTLADGSHIEIVVGLDR